MSNDKKANGGGWLSFVAGALDSLGLEDAAKNLEKDLGEFIGTVTTDTKTVVAKVLEEEEVATKVETSSSLSVLGDNEKSTSQLDDGARVVPPTSTSSLSSSSSFFSATSPPAPPLSSASEYIVVSPDGGGREEKGEVGGWSAILSSTPSAPTVGTETSAVPQLSAIQRLQARLESGEAEEDSGWGDVEEEDDEKTVVKGASQ